MASLGDAVHVRNDGDAPAGRSDVWERHATQEREVAAAARAVKWHLYAFLAYAMVLALLRWTNVNSNLTFVATVVTIMGGLQLLVMCATYLWRRSHR